MEINNILAVFLGILILVLGFSVGTACFINQEIVEVDKVVIQETLVEKDCPICICPEVVIPEIENADNALLNEFLENEFSVEFDEIKSAAEPFALEELEDDDYEVIVDYLKSLLSDGEELDESSVDISIDDINVVVTALGLGEDEDKSARVTFEIEVEYELEEGVVEEFKKDFVVVYDVIFEDGDFNDEEVEFVSIA